MWLDEKCTFLPAFLLNYDRKLASSHRNRSIFPPFGRKRITEAVVLYVLDYGNVIYRHALPSNLLNLGPKLPSDSSLVKVMTLIIVSFVANLADLPHLRRDQQIFF